MNPRIHECREMTALVLGKVVGKVVGKVKIASKVPANPKASSMAEPALNSRNP